MDYVRDVLCEDWSEIPLPDFSKAAMGDVEELNRFFSLVILALKSKAALRMEFEGLLGDAQDDGDYIANEIKRITPFRRKLRQILHQDTHAELTKDSSGHLQAENAPPDYRSEYGSLELLYDTVSQEADALRAQLMQSEREKVAIYQDLECLRTKVSDLQRELIIIREDKERVTTQCNDLALSNTKALIGISSYQSEINRTLDQIKGFVGPLTEIGEIPTQLSKMAQKQSELQTLLVALEKELSHAEQTISGLQITNNSLQLLLEEARNRLVSIVAEEQRRYGVLKAEHQELIENHIKLQSLNDNLILERESAKIEVKKAIDEKDSALRHAQQLEAVIGSFEHLKSEALLAQRMEYQTSEQMLNSQVLYWQKLYQGATSSLEAAEVGLKKKVAELKCLANRLDIEAAQRSQISKRNESLVSKITTMKDQLREFRSSLRAAQLENQELTSKSAADTKALSHFRTVLSELEATKARLQDEVAVSSAQAHALENALRSNQEEHALRCIRLETELQKSHQELIQLRELDTCHKEEIERLQASLRREEERSSLNEQQHAKYDQLIVQNDKLEHEVESLLESLASERQDLQKLKETLKATHYDLKLAQERLVESEDYALRLERELEDERHARSCIEQSSHQARGLKCQQHQKWVEQLNILLSEITQIKEDIRGMVTVDRDLMLAVNHGEIAALRAALGRRSNCDLGIETEREHVSEAKLIESRIEQEKQYMKEEHESVLTYIHQLGCQLYQSSFFTTS